MGQALPQASAHHKSYPHFPSARASLPPHPRVCFLPFLSQISKSTGAAGQGRWQERSSSLGWAFFTRDFFYFAATLFSALACLLAVGVCWNQNWRKALGILLGNKRAFVQEDLEEEAVFTAAASVPVFPVPKSTWPCQRAPGHGRAGGGMGRRWQSRGWALPGHRGCVGRGTDTSHTCQQCKSSTELPKYPCIKAHPNLCAWLCSFLAP